MADDNIASTAIMASLQKLEQMTAELNDYWNEVVRSDNTILKTAEVNPQPITTAPVAPFHTKPASPIRLAHPTYVSISQQKNTLLGSPSTSNDFVSMDGTHITANVQGISAGNSLDISPIKSSPYESNMAGYKDDDLLQRLHDVSIV